MSQMIVCCTLYSSVIPLPLPYLLLRIGPLAFGELASRSPTAVGYLQVLRERDACMHI